MLPFVIKTYSQQLLQTQIDYMYHKPANITQLRIPWSLHGYVGIRYFWLWLRSGNITSQFAQTNNYNMALNAGY